MDKLSVPIGKEPQMMVLICFCLVYFDGHQFAAFRVPLDRRFLLSIPDLLEIPHVKLDATSQILFYSAVVQGLFIDPDPVPDRAILIRNIYLLVADLAEIWANSVQITVPDLYASFFVVSIPQTQIVKKLLISHVAVCVIGKLQD